jgi:hypothetical protein
MRGRDRAGHVFGRNCERFAERRDDLRRRKEVDDLRRLGPDEPGGAARSPFVGVEFRAPGVGDLLAQQASVSRRRSVAAPRRRPSLLRDDGFDPRRLVLRRRRCRSRANAPASIASFTACAGLLVVMVNAPNGFSPGSARWARCSRAAFVRRSARHWRHACRRRCPQPGRTVIFFMPLCHAGLTGIDVAPVQHRFAADANAVTSPPSSSSSCTAWPTAGALRTCAP